MAAIHDNLERMANELSGLRSEVDRLNYKWAWEHTRADEHKRKRGWAEEAFAKADAERDHLRAVNAEMLEALETIVANAEIQPDAKMSGLTDVYAVPTDDIDDARAALTRARG